MVERNQVNFTGPFSVNKQTISSLKDKTKEERSVEKPTISSTPIKPSK